MGYINIFLTYLAKAINMVVDLGTAPKVNVVLIKDAFTTSNKIH